MAPKASTSKEKEKSKEGSAPPKKKAKTTTTADVKPTKVKPVTKAQVKGLGTIERRIYDAALAKNEVMAETDLRKEVGMEEGQDWIEALNSLARKGLLTVLSMGKHQGFKAVPMATAKAHSNLEDEVRLVLNVIIEHKDLGIWKRTLKIKTNLHEQTVTKCLKELEGRKLIKGVKSVKFPTRKFYMGADFTPSVELTGGPWYRDDRELDIELIETLLWVCDKYIVEKTCVANSRASYTLNPTSVYPEYPTIEAIRDYVKGTKLLKEHLSDANYKNLIDILVAQGHVEPIPIVRHAKDGWGAAPKPVNGAIRNGRKRKRVDNDYDSDDIDADDSEEEEDESDVEPAPSMDLDNGDVKRIGPPGSHDYIVYRSILNVSAVDKNEKQRLPRPSAIYESGTSTGPCGSCPVREHCHNVGRPRYRETGGQPTVKRYPPKYQPLELHIPSATDQNETVGSEWRGGGRKGADATKGLVNPEDCSYYTRWAAFADEMPAEREIEAWKAKLDYWRAPYDW